MTRSSTTTATTTSTQNGHAKALNSPQPSKPAAAEMPTAAAGNTRRRMTVSRMTIPMLLIHRTVFDTRRGRRGAASSHSATRTNIPRNALKRTCGSNLTMRSCIAAIPLRRQSFPVQAKDTGELEATATCTRSDRWITDSRHRCRIAASSVDCELGARMADQPFVREVLRTMASNSFSTSRQAGPAGGGYGQLQSPLCDGVSFSLR